MTTKATKTKKARRKYLIETNRAVHDNIRWVQRNLERFGIEVDRLRHKTALVLKRPLAMSWDEFKFILAKIVQQRIGQILLFSCTTGRAFSFDNTSNEPGMFKRVA